MRRTPRIAIIGGGITGLAAAASLHPHGIEVAVYELQLVAWCHACLHQVEPDIAALVERYGAELEVPQWGARLRCSKCGSRYTDFVVCGYSPPHE